MCPGRGGRSAPVAEERAAAAPTPSDTLTSGAAGERRRRTPGVVRTKASLPAWNEAVEVEVEAAAALADIPEEGWRQYMITMTVMTP